MRAGIEWGCKTDKRRLRQEFLKRSKCFRRRYRQERRQGWRKTHKPTSRNTLSARESTGFRRPGLKIRKAETADTMSGNGSGAGFPVPPAAPGSSWMRGWRWSHLQWRQNKLFARCRIAAAENIRIAAFRQPLRPYSVRKDWLRISFVPHSDKDGSKSEERLPLQWSEAAASLWIGWPATERKEKTALRPWNMRPHKENPMPSPFVE